ncbi:TlpA family protein disulfide reductase [Neotamlana laminarinivorans]|uniref:TlpA family protein disulfide reductase n=1 Tax=Neotamlana laminarinivorans TaxID=2883124 RepID=A0A9X1HZZ6_9FLAO|nr:TlpA disulfide reductase family protein [Tamlana laminarinivorans]MCB4798440.1 TlpA family protein disulfide reductase [Tamlana laminarinivorans]
MKRTLLILLFLPSLLLAQHTIKGVFSPAEEFKATILYKVTPTISKYVASYELEEDGSFVLKLDSTATKGMYRLVYALPQEDYNFDIIYNGKEDIELTFNPETGVSFIKSTENKLLASYTNSMSLITQSLSNYFSSQSKDTTALKAIFKTQRETQVNFEKAAENTIAQHFIKANKPYIPKHAENVKTYISNLRKHYFDYIDFSNTILQSSNFLDEKMLNYVFGMSDNTKSEVENYKQNIREFCKAMNKVPLKTKRILLFDLWQQMVDLGLEPVANFISEDYLMDIAVKLNDQELLQSLILYKNLSNGSIAPDFTIELKTETKTTKQKLSELKLAEHYVIVFWSSTCSHCLDEVPQLHKFVKTLEKGKVKVIAVGLEDQIYGWKTLTYEYPEFIHVYGEGKWDNPIGDDYGVTATPTYFVLDQDKKIESKPENFEALKSFFSKE